MNADTGTPSRVQRTRRVKNIPAIYVGRPTKWGNPVSCEGEFLYISTRIKDGRGWVPYMPGTVRDAVNLFERILKGETFTNEYLQLWVKEFQRNDISELKGKTLSCWCAPGSPCHADILLKYANSS